jgi:hypothetical protein
VTRPGSMRAIVRAAATMAFREATTGPWKRRRARIAVAELERLSIRRDEDITTVAQTMQRPRHEQ